MTKTNNKTGFKKGMGMRREILLLVIFMLSSQAIAQYNIKKHTINSGGSTMVGGSYQVSSSIGQVDASNTLTGGTYSVTGGFWNKATVTNTTELIFKNSFESI